MGQARNKQRAAFAVELVEGWENEDCVNFAVALARPTNWLLHVDWWSTSRTPRDDEIKPIRVYVANNDDLVFDVRGIRTIFEFNERIIMKAVPRVATGPGGVLTRFYDEERLASLPLRFQPCEAKIASAIEAIRANQQFLSAIPPRTAPFIPASEAAHFTFGRCAPFAEAMQELTGLQPMAMLAKRFSQKFEGTERGENGYFHSVVMHPDGIAEDSWGRSSLTEIAARFGVLEFSTSSDVQAQVVERLIRNSAGRYEAAFERAKQVILTHRR